MKISMVNIDVQKQTSWDDESFEISHRDGGISFPLWNRDKRLLQDNQEFSNAVSYKLR